MTQITADAPHEQLAELERQRDAELRARTQLAEVAIKLTSTLNLKELLQLIMTSAAELLDAETASLMLVDNESNELTIEVATGSVGGQVERRRIPAGAGVAGWALSHREIAVVDDPATDKRFFGEVGTAIGFTTRNLLALPLLVKDRAVGVVEVLNKKAGQRFTQRDVELATAFAGLAAAAVDNSRLYAHLAEALVTARMSYRL